MGKAKTLIAGELLSHLGGGRPDPYTWVFSSTDNSHYNYNSQYLFEYVKEHVPEVTPLFVINDDTLRQKLSEKFGAQYFFETKSVQGIQRALSAGVWFTVPDLPETG